MPCTACGSPFHDRINCLTLPGCHICEKRMGSNLLCDTCHHHFCWADWEGHGCPEAEPELPPEDDRPPLPRGIEVKVRLTLTKIEKGPVTNVAVLVPGCDIVNLKFDVRFAKGLYGRAMAGGKRPAVDIGQTLELQKALLRLPEGCDYLIRKWCGALAIRQKFLELGVL